jgi:hypothetical protein
MNRLACTSMAFLMLSVSPTLADPPSGAVGLALLLTDIGGGVYRTDALSISVGFGAGEFSGYAWASEAGIATAVGSSGTVIEGPAQAQEFETQVCLDLSACQALIAGAGVSEE